MDHPKIWLSGIGVISIFSGVALYQEGIYVFISGITVALISVFCLIQFFNWQMKISCLENYISRFPLIKDITACVSEAFLVVFIPVFAYSHVSVKTMFLFIYVLLLLLIREIMVDSRELQVDLISGKHTILMFLGKNRIQFLLQMLVLIWAMTIIIPVGMGILNTWALIFTLVPLFYAFYVYLFHDRLMFLRITSDLAIESGTWIFVALSIVFYLVRS